jgi:hypothetical protein
MNITKGCNNNLISAELKGNRMLKTKREYEFTTLKRFYLNENISIRLIEGTLDELVEKYKIDKQYLMTYIENINRENVLCLSEKSVSEEMYKEEENIYMLDESENAPKPENEFINKSPIHESAAENINYNLCLN